MTVTLYWRAEAPPSQRLTLSAQLRGLDPMARIADDTRWLGGTLYPAAYWRVGDVIAHTVTLQAPDWAPAPALVWLDLHMLDADDHRITFSPGDRDTATLGPWRVAGAVTVPRTATAVKATLGDAIRLEAYEVRRAADGQLLVDLYWRATAKPARDVTVFLHWIGANGTLIAQDDGPPAGGAYPTSWWQAGDVVRDTRILEGGAVSKGGDLWVGMYTPSTGERLPAGDADGRHLPDDAIPLLLPE